MSDSGSPNMRLFVYGSLRSGFQHSAYQYIRDYFNFEGPAMVKGLLYDLGEYPAAVPTQTENYIKGELYALRNEDEFGWAMAQLDDYEGVNTEFGEIALYKRAIATVLINGQTTDAWIYWYNGDVSGHPIIASGDVLKYLQEKNRP
jgi:gamma-glutamylcyclotransferase (GGCT)/AIG2-like uncharacterized protein YtfP